MRHFAGVILVAVLLSSSVTAVLADPTASANAPAAENVKALALRWYTQMQAGQLDRTQLTAAYSAQLTDDAVRQMSSHVNLYGASPTSAEILRAGTIADQKFYLVKLIFPRGDAASLLIGFDAQGKITGINLMSMAGD
jgi:hypothetical protein